MTTELTLREKVRDVLYDFQDADRGIVTEDVLHRIADLLSATGAPAYIRVADDLRGEWVDEDDAPAWTSEDFKTAQISKDGAVLREASGDLRGVVREEVE